LGNSKLKEKNVNHLTVTNLPFLYGYGDMSRPIATEGPKPLVILGSRHRSPVPTDGEK